MKKLLIVGLAGLLAAGLGASRAAAGWFSKCDKCYTTIRCKQYNAFSPHPGGNVTLDSCCFLPGWSQGNWGHGGGGHWSNCEDGACLGELPAAETVINESAAPPVAGHAVVPAQPAAPGIQVPQAPVYPAPQQRPILPGNPGFPAAGYYGYPLPQQYGMAPPAGLPQGSGFQPHAQGFNPQFGYGVPAWGNVPYYWNSPGLARNR